jgi:hypothetical protein
MYFYTDQQDQTAFSPPPVYNAASPVSSFGNATSKAHGSMKLGHKTKTLGELSDPCCYFFFLNVCFEDLDLETSNTGTRVTHSSTPSSIPVNKDDRKAELERRREERRQVCLFFFIWSAVN